LHKSICGSARTHTHTHTHKHTLRVAMTTQKMNYRQYFGEYVKDGTECRVFTSTGGDGGGDCLLLLIIIIM